MALFNVTVKMTQTVNGERLEKGMSAEVAYGTRSTFSPLQTLDGKAKVAEAFKFKYGVDLKKACALDAVHLSIEKLN